MGFFKDLRDDISQAVNELLPDDAFFELDEDLEEETMSKSEDNAELLVDSESVDDIGDTLAELEKMVTESDDIEKSIVVDNTETSEGISDEEMQEDILAALAHLGDDTDNGLSVTKEESPVEEIALEEELSVVEEAEQEELLVEEVALEEELPVIEEAEQEELPVEEIELEEELPVIEEADQEELPVEEIALEEEPLEELPFDDVVIEEEENFEEESNLLISDESETNEESVSIEAVEPIPETVMDVIDTTQEIEAAMDIMEEPNGPEDLGVAEEEKMQEDIATEEVAMDNVETETFEGYELENLGEEPILEPMEEIANSAEVSEDTSMLDDISANTEQQTDYVDTMGAVDVSAVEEVMEENITEKEVKAMENNFENAEATSEVTVITKGTVINGSITSDGGLEVNGTITGDVECLGKLTINGNVSGHLKAAEVIVSTPRLDGGIDSQGDVKVGVGTIVIGDITAKSATISGAVKGEVDVQGPVVVDSTAIVKGNITAKSVQINNGAVVDGYCKLAYAEVDIDNFFDGE